MARVGTITTLLGGCDFGSASGTSPPWSGSGTGSTAEGREGARAKRARSIDGFGTAPYPAAGSGDPFPLSLRSRGTKLRGGEILTVVPTGRIVRVPLLPEWRNW